jgi:hypothetical protein
MRDPVPAGASHARRDPICTVSDCPAVARRGPCSRHDRRVRTSASIPDLIAELVFGVYCAEEPIRTEDAPETASGVINIVPDLPRIRFPRRSCPLRSTSVSVCSAGRPTAWYTTPSRSPSRTRPFPTAGSRWSAGRRDSGGRIVQPDRLFLRRARKSWCWAPGPSSTCRRRGAVSRDFRGRAAGPGGAGAGRVPDGLHVLIG